jgi:GTP-binding protein
VRRQAEAALGDADAVILVVDAVEGLHPLDAEVAELVRRHGKRAVIAANKCDHPRQDGHADEFERLGFPVRPVSAFHDRGTEELMDAVLQDLPHVARAEAEPEPLRVAIVGHPNVGKSSFINRLLRAERTLVSDVPGTTRDSVEVRFRVGSGPTARHYALVDTAGIRRLGKIDTAVERFSVMRSERTIERADVVVLVLDAAQGPTAQDKTIAALIEQHGRSYLVVVNKWDRMEGVASQKEYLEALVRHAPFLTDVPVVFASARTGFNVRQVWSAVDRLAAAAQQTIATGPLNRILREAMARTAPPSIATRRFKLYYAVQTGSAPIRLALFVNDPDLLTPAYRQYLLRRLRDEFGLQGVHIALEMRVEERKRHGF